MKLNKVKEYSFLIYLIDLNDYILDDIYNICKTFNYYQLNVLEENKIIECIIKEKKLTKETIIKRFELPEIIEIEFNNEVDLSNLSLSISQTKNDIITTKTLANNLINKLDKQINNNKEFQKDRDAILNLELFNHPALKAIEEDIGKLIANKESELKSLQPGIIGQMALSASGKPVIPNSTIKNRINTLEKEITELKELKNILETKENSLKELNVILNYNLKQLNHYNKKLNNYLNKEKQEQEIQEYNQNISYWKIGKSYNPNKNNQFYIKKITKTYNNIEEIKKSIKLLDKNNQEYNNLIKELSNYKTLYALTNLDSNIKQSKRKLELILAKINYKEEKIQSLNDNLNKKDNFIKEIEQLKLQKKSIKSTSVFYLSNKEKQDNINALDIRIKSLEKQLNIINAEINKAKNNNLNITLENLNLEVNRLEFLNKVFKEKDYANYLEDNLKEIKDIETNLYLLLKDLETQHQNKIEEKRYQAATKEIKIPQIKEDNVYTRWQLNGFN